MSDPQPRRRIRAQSSPRDPSVMRFILDSAVQEGAERSYEETDENAPLAVALFAINGIRKVQVSGETVLISLAPGHDWADYKAAVAAAIRQVLDSSNLPLGENEPDGAEKDAALLAAVNHVLDNEANPSIAQHDGHVTAERAEDGVVYLRMSGSCQGCAASSLTLRGNVERILRASVPGIRDIVDVTDHSAGTNPYYQRIPSGEGAITPLDQGQGARTSRPDIPNKKQVTELIITRLADRIRLHLRKLSAEDVPITYAELAKALGMSRPGSIRRVTTALELTMRQDAAAGRPFLAARVASRGSGQLPGRGFFDLAIALGRGPGEAEDWASYHRRELEATFLSDREIASASEAG